MARGKGEGSITELKDGTFIARMTRGKKPDGKPNVKSRRAKTRKEAREKLKEIEAEFDAEKGIAVEFKNMPLVDYTNEFLEYKRTTLKPTSYMRLESTIREHIQKPFEMYLVSEIDSRDIQNLINSEQRSGASYSSVKKIHDAFSGLYKFAIMRRDCKPSDNPMLSVVMPPKKLFPQPNKDVRFFTPEQRELFINEASRKYRNGRPVYRYGNTLIFLLNTGLREAEICGLQRENVNVEEKFIEVTKTAVTVKIDGRYKTVLQEDGKYSSNRYVPLNESALNCIKEMLSQFTHDELVICSVNNKPLPPVEITKAFNRVCETIGLKENMKGVGAHCLRHTFASSLFESGVNIKVISELLGHTSVSVTEDTYISIINKLKAKAIEMPEIL